MNLFSYFIVVDAVEIMYLSVFSLLLVAYNSFHPGSHNQPPIAFAALEELLQAFLESAVI